MDIEEKVNQIVVLKNNYDYSIGDIFANQGEGWEIRRDRVLTNSKYDGTILKNYLLKLIEMQKKDDTLKKDMGLMYECVNKYISDHSLTTLEDDEIVIHCRLGDKVLIEEKRFQERHIDEIKMIISKNVINKITLLTCFNYGHCPDEGHYEKYDLKYKFWYKEHVNNYNRKYMSNFIEKVQSTFGGDIQIISSENSDIDFCYGIRAKFFVGGNGGFSTLMKRMNKMYHEEA